MKEKSTKAKEKDIQGNTPNKVLEKQQTIAKEQPGITSKTSLTNTNDKDKGKTHLHENANEHHAVNKGQGLLVALFVKEKVLGPLAEKCKYTLIGKFTHTMPKVELIRKSFILQTQLSGGVMIAHYNARHAYIDLDNELDYNTVWTKQRMSIAGQLMRIQDRTPSLKPEVETPIVPVWVTLPDFPSHCYNKDYVTGLLILVGKVLYLDSASIQKTKGSKAKVKVQIDLSKERPPHVWMGYKGEELTDGRWQTIEHEDVHPYCFYCMHQGHMDYECSIKQKDEDQKRRREVEEQGKNKSCKEIENKEQQHKPHRDQSSRIGITNNRKQDEQKEAQ
ncbi:hypothetical protein H5410_050937 [Solanum commersonii]|uniref:DUF4283 domain-containing protein n=1 Tax=Solanum commersonii TaxID=4109 RepID=A0A9J5WZ95_SOLCO|nr:hypothetical protein H5410_050937 [Solanum commersonii]